MISGVEARVGVVDGVGWLVLGCGVRGCVGGSDGAEKSVDGAVAGLRAGVRAGEGVRVGARAKVRDTIVTICLHKYA